MNGVYVMSCGRRIEQRLLILECLANLNAKAERRAA